MSAKNDFSDLFYFNSARWDCSKSVCFSILVASTHASPTLSLFWSTAMCKEEVWNSTKCDGKIKKEGWVDILMIIFYLMCLRMYKWARNMQMIFLMTFSKINNFHSLSWANVLEFCEEPTKSKHSWINWPEEQFLYSHNLLWYFYGLFKWHWMNFFLFSWKSIFWKWHTQTEKQSKLNLKNENTNVGLLNVINN